MDDQIAQIILTDIRGIRKDIKDGNEVLHKRMSDGFGRVNGRIRILEAWRNWVMGGLAVTGVITGILIKMGVFNA